MEFIGIGILTALVILTLIAFCLVGLGNVRFISQWEAVWEGHHILARTWVTPLLVKGGEELVIDGVLAPKRRPSLPRLSEDLYGEIIASDKVHKVHAHIQQTSLWGNIECVIYVDEIPVSEKHH